MATDYYAILFTAASQDGGMHLDFGSRAEREQFRNMLFMTMKREIRKWGEIDPELAGLSILREGKTGLHIVRLAIPYTVVQNQRDKVKND